MPLTREFKETIMLRVKQDPDFRQSLIVEATNALLDGDFDTGKSLLRDYLNATESLPAIAGGNEEIVVSSRGAILASNTLTTNNCCAIVPQLSVTRTFTTAAADELLSV